MNNDYHAKIPLIKSEGNRTINEIVDKTANFGINATRLNAIAAFITENFTDIYWPSQQNEDFFCYYTNGDGKGEWIWCAPYNGFFGKNPQLYGYISDRKGGVRTILANDLNYDPQWIAYQKTGACEALSIFFNETANRSGFVSRIVTTNGSLHTWNEVMIDGEWKYYDVQRYGQVKNTNESSSWFGNRSEYGKKSGFSYSELTKNGIYVFDFQTKKCGNESVTWAYFDQSQ